jgi:group I intron endonuclease
MNHSKHPELNKSGIYKIQSQIKPSRLYVGSSYCMRIRRNKHFLDFKKNIHHSPKLQRHYNKYGGEDLVFSIIELCDISILEERENYYIKLYHPYFNCNPNANNKMGMVVSIETRKKQSEAKKGKRISPATEFKKGELTQLGVHPSQETRNKISEGLKKFYQDHPEAKDHLRDINKGKVLSDEIIEKMSIALTGRIVSEETRKKISLSNMGKSRPSPMKGKKQKPESIEKMRQKLIGRKDSEETKKKKGVASKKAWERRKSGL